MENQIIEVLEHELENPVYPDLLINQFNEEAGWEGSDCLLVSRFRAFEFTDIQIAKIITVLNHTCIYCFDSNKNCCCREDD